MTVLIPTSSVPNINSDYGGHLGNKFTVSEAVEVTAFQVYKSGGSDPNPIAFRLYNFTTGVKLREVLNPVIAAFGFSLVDMPSPITLQPGTTYVVAERSGTALAHHGYTAAPTAESPFTLVGTVINNGGDQTSDMVPIGGSWEAVAVGVSGGPAGPQPPADPPDNEPDPGTVDPGGSLAYWLHQDTANPDSLPKINNTRLNEIKAMLDTEMADLIAVVGSTGSSGDGTVMGRLALLLPMVAALTAVAADVTTILGQVWGSGNALEDVQTKVDNLYTAQTIQAGRDRIPLTDVSWVETDAVIGSGGSIWTVAADAYVLTITNPAEFRSGYIVGGMTYFGHRGFWSPITIDLVEDHHTFVGTKTIMRVPGMRMAGVLFNVDPHLTWTLQAFDYIPGGA